MAMTDVGARKKEPAKAIGEEDGDHDGNRETLKTA